MVLMWPRQSCKPVHQKISIKDSSKQVLKPGDSHRASLSYNIAFKFKINPEMKEITYTTLGLRESR